MRPEVHHTSEKRGVREFFGRQNLNETLTPPFDRAFTTVGQPRPQPDRMMGSVTMAASTRFSSGRGSVGGGGREGGALRAIGRALGRVFISLPIAVAATMYQLPARMIISGIKEAGGDVQSPWGETVTALGNAETQPRRTLANLLGVAPLSVALLVTVVKNIPILWSNLVNHPIKTIGGFAYGVVKGAVGFTVDKAREIGSTITGNGPSYFNLAAQYYTSGH